MSSITRSKQAARISTAAIVLLGLGGIAGFIATRAVSAAERENPAVQRSRAAAALLRAKAGPLVELQTAFEAIADKMSPSVVSITVDKKVTPVAGGDMQSLPFEFRNMPGMPQFRSFGGPTQPYTMRGEGSGVIVRSDGWILTNDHVVNNADHVTVKLNDGRELKGTVRADFRSDLALVKVDASNLVPADLGDSSKVRVGQWAVAFGSPFELENSMTLGIVSAQAREQAIPDHSGGPGAGRMYTNLLQTDAAINPGNSGGALVDILGNVVGINVAIESPSGGSVGIGFAIPINTAKDVMNQLITTGKVVRGFLGVVPRDPTYTEKKSSGLSAGALIQQVEDGSPAATAGLQPGDIVTRVNGQPVADEAGFRDQVAHVTPGQKLTMSVHRDGGDQTLTATVGTPPENPGQVAPVPEKPAPTAKLGIRVEPISPDLEKQFKLHSTSGVVVAEVSNGSPAESAGLQPGTVITRVNGHAVHTQADVESAISGSNSGDTVTMVVETSKAKSLITIQLP